MPFYSLFFVGEGSPTQIDDGKKSGTLILTSLEDLDSHPPSRPGRSGSAWDRDPGTGAGGVPARQPEMKSDGAWGGRERGEGAQRSQLTASK